MSKGNKLPRTILIGVLCIFAVARARGDEGHPAPAQSPEQLADMLSMSCGLHPPGMGGGFDPLGVWTRCVHSYIGRWCMAAGYNPNQCGPLVEAQLKPRMRGET